jgi:chloride channel protein, CIC family
MKSPLEHIQGGWIVIIPAIGLLLSWLLTQFVARESKGHGVPEVMEAVAFRKGIIRKRVVAVKALASSITIATGGSVGREGPIVQIGSALGSSVGQYLKLKTGFIKILLACGAAGGVAATFNAPIAGVIFAFEIILLEFKTRSFAPLVISTVMATVVSRIHLGAAPAFEIPHYSMQHPIELVFYLGLGVLAALVGVLTIKTLYKTEDFVDDLKIPAYSKPILGGLILGSVGYFFPHIFGVGYEAVSQTLMAQTTFLLMLFLVFLKIGAMSLTIACGGSGGVFAPSLFIGAMLGGAYGYGIHLLFPGITAGHGAYALVGMAAVFCATGRATLTAIVILFEMTLVYQIILPLMFACVIADQLASYLLPDSIYTLKLRRRGVRFSQDMGINILEVHRVGDVMSTNMIFAEDEMTVRDVREKLLPTGHLVFPIINDLKKVTGWIHVNEVRKHIRSESWDLKVKDFKTQPPIFGYPSESLIFALRKMEKMGLSKLLILERESRKFVGMLTTRDIMRATLKDS